MDEMLETPIVFARELRDDVFVFHFQRQHFPGVGFNLQMRAQRGFFFQNFQQAGDVIGGVVEQRGLRTVNWHMKMNAPFGVVDGGSGGGECEREVFVARD